MTSPRRPCERSTVITPYAATNQAQTVLLRMECLRPLKEAPAVPPSLTPYTQMMLMSVMRAEDHWHLSATTTGVLWTPYADGPVPEVVRTYDIHTVIEAKREWRGLELMRAASAKLALVVNEHIGASTIRG